MARSRHVREREHVGSGSSRCGVCDSGGRGRRIRSRSPSGPPRPAGRSNGLLHVRERRDRRAARPDEARSRARRGRRLRRAPRQRHRGTVPRRSERPHGIAAPVAVLARERRAGRELGGGRQCPARQRARATRSTKQAFERRRRAGGATHSSPSSSSSRPASTRIGTIRWRRWPLTASGFRELARRCATLAPRTAAVLEGRLQPRDAADPRGGRSRRDSRARPRPRAPTRAARAPRGATRRRASSAGSSHASARCAPR